MSELFSGRVALIHDWLTGMRGGEMVLLELCRLFPGADLFTLVHHRGSVDPLIEARRIIESPLVKIPGARRRFRALLPLFPWAAESFSLRGYELVISSSHCVAKGVIPDPEALHLSYVHSPMRYVWDVRDDYQKALRIATVSRFAMGWAAHYLRSWDALSSARVDRFIANSCFIAARINKFYRRDAEVIHPPVDVDWITPAAAPRGDYFLTVSALVPYKRVDLAVEACNRLKVRLKVVGDGSEAKRLRRVAGRTVEFTGPLSRQELLDLYRNAAALIHPAVEDFGIAPVEAQAAGRPVIAFKRGGCAETVVTEGSLATGILFREQTVDSLAEAIRGFKAADFDPEASRANAAKFSRKRFTAEMSATVRRALEEARHRGRI